MAGLTRHRKNKCMNVRCTSLVVSVTVTAGLNGTSWNRALLKNFVGCCEMQQPCQTVKPCAREWRQHVRWRTQCFIEEDVLCSEPRAEFSLSSAKHTITVFHRCRMTLLKYLLQVLCLWSYDPAAYCSWFFCVHLSENLKFVLLESIFKWHLVCWPLPFDPQVLSNWGTWHFTNLFWQYRIAAGQ